MDKVLVVSCSRRKRPDADLLPAIERYDGPAFRVLRRNLASNEPASFRLFILSAEFGLIPHTCPIPNYNRPMDLARATEIKPWVLAQLRRIFETDTRSDVAKVREVFLCLTRSYSAAIEGVEDCCPGGTILKRSDVSRGRMLASLHGWLNRDFVGRQKKDEYLNEVMPVFRGTEIPYTAEQINEIARTELSRREWQNDQSYWHIQVDGRRIGVKKLASLLSGLPVAKFHTDAAKRLLLKLGMRVIGA